MMNDYEKERIEKCVVQIECINKADKNDIEFGTGFFVENNIIITASHVINKYYTNPSDYCINIIPIKANIGEPIKVQKTIEHKRNNYVSILELEVAVEGIIPLKFTLGYQIKRDKEYFTFGHPNCKRNIGERVENRITTTIINPGEPLKANWDLNLSNERLENFEGFSGSPVVIDNMLVGIVQTEAMANGKALSIGMSSIDIIKEFIPDEYCEEYNAFNILRAKNFDNNKIYTINDIDKKLKESTDSAFGLSFFEIDDEDFKKKFREKISLNNIYVVGKSREETLYCILNELKVLEYNDVAIVGDDESWEYLRDKVNGSILIPNFYVGEIVAIKNNVNIFIYGEDEHCTKPNKIELRRRTRSIIIKKLEEAGLENAYDYVKKTNGLFIPLMRKLFNGQYNILPAWSKQNSTSFVVALLCGKWTECQGDKAVIETLSGKSYEDFLKDLLPFTKGGEPFVIEVLNFGEKIYQLANSEIAWGYLGDSVGGQMWDQFKKILHEVITKIDPIFNKPFEDHYMASLDAAKPEHSNALKSGMIRSLIFIGIFREQKQCEIDKLVEKTLSTIKSVQHWGYFAQFFTKLCEASPKSVMEMLEKELNQSTGMIELFSSSSREISGRNYYTHVLWAVEQLFLYKEYAARAIRWLFVIDAMNLKYNISNSPRGILGDVFCAWVNITALNVKEKIQLAQDAIIKYENTWYLLLNQLPGKHQFVCSQSKPQYHNFDEIENITNQDVYETYNAYAKLCIEHIGGRMDRWNKVISEFSIFPDVMLDNLLTNLSALIHEISDSDKRLIKDELRNEIYRHRFFAKSAWAMEEVRLQKIEGLMNSIIFNDEVYEYLYLFNDIYNMPILHPVPFESNDSIGRNENFVLREKEIEERLVKFKNDKLDVIHLIELVSKDHYRRLGECVAKYYTDGKFDNFLYEKLINTPNIENIILSYIRYIYFNGDKSVIKKAKLLSKGYNGKDELYVGLLSIEELNYSNHPEIINEAPHIKQLYWSKPSGSFAISNDSVTLTWALNEYKKYNNAASYIENLYHGVKILKPEEVLQYMNDLKNLNLCDDQLKSFCLTEIMDYIEKSFDGIYDKYEEIFHLEMWLRSIMKWEDMKCSQYLFKRNPQYYAGIIDVIFLHEGEEKGDITKEQGKLVHSLFDFYNKALFCPCEDNKDINLKELQVWVEKFIKQLKKQNQLNLLGHTLGRLFAYSPVGKDGYYPHEAVRQIIEEFSDKTLRESYKITESNKRGVYYPDAGKSEKELALKYKENANSIRISYPESAKIYDDLYESYLYQSKAERRFAEDGYY